MRDIRNGEVSARDRAVCANALDRILERKRILRMKPLPKAVDAYKYEDQKKRRAADRASFTEPVELPVEAKEPTTMVKSLKERMRVAPSAA